MKTIQTIQKWSLGSNKIPQKGSLEPGEIVGKSDTKCAQIICFRKRGLGETEGLNIRFIFQSTVWGYWDLPMWACAAVRPMTWRSVWGGETLRQWDKSPSSKLSTVKQPTFQNVWPRPILTINLVTNPRDARFEKLAQSVFFLASSAAKYWKRQIGNAPSSQRKLFRGYLAIFVTELSLKEIF